MSIVITTELKPHQKQAAAKFTAIYKKYKGALCSDEMGLGKTVQTIALFAYLMESKNLNGPFLVVVPLATLSNWEQEFARWAPSITVCR